MSPKASTGQSHSRAARERQPLQQRSASVASAETPTQRPPEADEDMTDADRDREQTPAPAHAHTQTETHDVPPSSSTTPAPDATRSLSPTLPRSPSPTATGSLALTRAVPGQSVLRDQVLQQLKEAFDRVPLKKLSLTGVCGWLGVRAWRGIARGSHRRRDRVRQGQRATAPLLGASAAWTQVRMAPGM